MTVFLIVGEPQGIKKLAGKGLKNKSAIATHLNIGRTSLHRLLAEI